MTSILLLVSCAIGADTAGIEVVGHVGSSRFWHEHPVLDVHVAGDGTLRSLAGCTVHTWEADGTLEKKSTLKGCTEGLNDGVMSPDGEWVAASGLWTGEQGVWRSSGGDVVHRVESVTWSRFCAGGLWDVDGSKGFRRLDLETGEVTHPSGDHGTGFGCIGDGWMLDEHGHRIEADGSVVELPEIGDSREIVGETEDGQAIVYLYEQSLVRVDQEGLVTPLVPVPDMPETALVHDGIVYALDDGVDDVVWKVGADGVLQALLYAEGQGLGARAGLGLLFPWQGRVWGGAGHRLFPLEAPAGPDDSTGERFFFDVDELYVCHGSRCEARRVEDLGGKARTIELPDRVSDETKLSPFGRFFGQYDTEQLFRIELDTGAVEVLPMNEWVDGLSVDGSGHFRWRLSEDSDDDGIYTTRVLERRGEEEVVLGTWEEEWLTDPGWSVLQLGPTLRWPDGKKAGYADADNWFETADGHVFLLSGYGTKLEVFDGTGSAVATSRQGGDSIGPWADGAWVASGKTVRFVGPDLKERAQLTVPWSIDMLAVEGAGSPDGRHFAARGPDGRLHVWRLPDSLTRPLPAPPEAEPLRAHRGALRPGMQLGAPAYGVETASLFPEDWVGRGLPGGVTRRMIETLGYLDEPQGLVVAMAGFAPRTPQERAEQVAAIRELSSGWEDEDLYTLKDQFVALHRGGTYMDDEGEERRPDGPTVAKGVAAAVKRYKAKKTLAMYSAWREAVPVASGPAFGVEACPEAVAGTTAPLPPASSVSKPPRSHLSSILIRVDADGTPTWVGTEVGSRNDRGRSCFAAHQAPWTAASRAGEPVPACVRVPCWDPPTDEGYGL